ncbi:MAG: DUF1289 domain-containing protein [Hyphomicrobiaceae bacterium]
MTDTPLAIAPAPRILPDPGRDRHSPCVGVCQLDAMSGLCVGCARTGAEIADWPGMSDEGRLEVYARLPQRMARIGAAVRLLPWTADDILSFVAETLTARCGAWCVGTAGAAGFVRAGALGCDEFYRGPDKVSAEGAGGSFAIVGHEKLRAFAVQEDGRDGAIVLGLPRRRADELLARRLAPPRDWLMPPANADEDGCACRTAAGGDGASRERFLTALATLTLADSRSEDAARLIARAAPLPRFAVAMAVYDPAG